MRGIAQEIFTHDLLSLRNYKTIIQQSLQDAFSSVSSEEYQNCIEIGSWEIMAKERIQPQDKDQQALVKLSEKETNFGVGGDTMICTVKPPDGGWGWMVVLSSFLIHMIADGIAYSFGVFLMEFVVYFKVGRGAVSWIGALQPAVTCTVGPLASVLTKRYGCQKVTIAGAVIAAAGFMGSALAPNIYYLYFTAGIMAGVGFGFIYLPAIVCVAQYFEKRRSLASGLSVCGSGFGTFILAPITALLVEAYTWKGAMLILGGVILNVAFCGLLFRPLKTIVTLTRKASSESEASGFLSDAELDGSSSQRDLTMSSVRDSVDSRSWPVSDDMAISVKKVRRFTLLDKSPIFFRRRLMKSLSSAVDVSRNENNSSNKHSSGRSNMSELMGLPTQQTDERDDSTSTVGVKGSSKNMRTVGNEGPSKNMSTVGNEGPSNNMSTVGSEGPSNNMSTVGNEGPSKNMSTMGMEGPSKNMSTVGNKGPSKNVSTVGNEGPSKNMSTVGMEGTDMSTNPHLQSQVSTDPHLQSQVSTDPHLQSHVSTDPHLQSQVSTDSHLQSQVSTDSHLQSHVSTDPHLQSQVSTDSHLQSQVSTDSHLQSQVSTDPHLQSQVSTDPHLQSQVSTDPHLQSHVSDNHHSTSGLVNTQLTTYAPHNRRLSISLPQNSHIVIYERPNNHLHVPEPLYTHRVLPEPGNSCTCKSQRVYITIYDNKDSESSTSSECLPSPPPDSATSNSACSVASPQKALVPRVKSESALPSPSISRTSVRASASAPRYSSRYSKLYSEPASLSYSYPTTYPFSRKDIFYTGSLSNIPMYRCQPEVYQAIITSLPDQVPEMTDEQARGCFSFSAEFRATMQDMLSLTLLKNPVFLMFAVSNFFTSLGFNMPFIFLPDRAKLAGIDEPRASFLLSVIGIANTAGRIFFGFLSDRPWVNRLMLYNTALTICGTVTALSPLVGGDYLLLVVYSAVFGVFIGVYVSLTSVVLVDLLGLEYLTNSFGLLLLFQGAATFAGPPVAGFLCDWTGSYDLSFLLMGSLVAFSGLVLFFLPIVQRYSARRTSSGHRVRDLELGLKPVTQEDAEIMCS